MENKPTLDKRTWRGSVLHQDIVTHDDGTPVLEITYRARIPLKGHTLERRLIQGKMISQQLLTGLSEMPTVDKLAVRMGKVLRTEGFKGRRAQ